MNSIWQTSILFGVVIWFAATSVLGTAGNILVPEASGTGPVVFALLFAILAAIGGALVGFAVVRLVRPIDTGKALSQVSVAVVAVGLFADAILILACGITYPGLERSRLSTLLTGLLLAYSGLAIGPFFAQRALRRLGGKK